MRRAFLLLVLAGCGRLGFAADRCAGAPETTTTPLALGGTTDGVLCPGNVDVYTVALAAGDELEAELTPERPGWPTLEITDMDQSVRGLRTLESTVAGFADHDGVYRVKVAGVAAANGTPYRLSIRLRDERHVFVAPNGNDAAPGTFDQPWQRLDVAANRLVPGDVLVLQDGVYMPANNGWLHIDCAAGAANGTPTQPIRVTALTERRAEIASDGSDAPGRILGCSWWTIEGLHLENQDRMLPTNTEGGVLTIAGCSNLIVRRVLAAHNNRYKNAHGIFVAWSSSNVLVEECETYDISRSGIEVWIADNVTLRRNYSHSRGRGQIPGGFPSSVGRGDSGFSIGPAANALAENNVEEGNFAFMLSSFSGAGSGDVVDTQVYGNVSRGNDIGLRSFVLQPGYCSIATAQTCWTDVDCLAGETCIPVLSYNRRTRAENHVSIDSGYRGYSIQTNEDFACTGCTSIRSGGHGWEAYRLYPVQPTSSRCTSCLSVGDAESSFVFSNQSPWGLDHVNTFGNGSAAFSPPTAPEIIAPSAIDPMLGGCLVYLPADSPMRGAGPGGIDVGANVIYRYRDGQLTELPLWDPETGAFPCGAVVPGVNDDPTTACIGVHERLHVGTPDCALPYPAL